MWTPSQPQTTQWTLHQPIQQPQPHTWVQSQPPPQPQLHTWTHTQPQCTQSQPTPWVQPQPPPNPNPLHSSVVKYCTVSGPNQTLYISRLI